MRRRLEKRIYIPPGRLLGWGGGGAGAVGCPIVCAVPLRPSTCCSPGGVFVWCWFTLKMRRGRPHPWVGHARSSSPKRRGGGERLGRWPKLPEKSLDKLQKVPGLSAEALRTRRCRKPRQESDKKSLCKFLPIPKQALRWAGPAMTVRYPLSPRVAKTQVISKVEESRLLRSLPSEKDREELFKINCRDLPIDADVNFAELARKTDGLLLSDTTYFVCVCFPPFWHYHLLFCCFFFV